MAEEERPPHSEIKKATLRAGWGGRASTRAAHKECATGGADVEENRNHLRADLLFLYWLCLISKIDTLVTATAV